MKIAFFIKPRNFGDFEMFPGYTHIPDSPDMFFIPSKRYVIETTMERVEEISDMVRKDIPGRIIFVIRRKGASMEKIAEIERKLSKYL